MKRINLKVVLLTFALLTLAVNLKIIFNSNVARADYGNDYSGDCFSCEAPHLFKVTCWAEPGMYCVRQTCIAGIC